MRLSTKTRYGTRLLLELALNYHKGYIQLNEIARKQDLSEKYSEQIISHLKSAGLVQSLRGAQGGYILSRPASKINMKEVVEVLEGSLNLIGSPEQEKSRTSASSTQYVWARVSESVAGTLEKITLEDLVTDLKKQTSVINFEI